MIDFTLSTVFSVIQKFFNNWQLSKNGVEFKWIDKLLFVFIKKGAVLLAASHTPVQSIDRVLDIIEALS